MTDVNDILNSGGLPKKKASSRKRAASKAAEPEGQDNRNESQAMHRRLPSVWSRARGGEAETRQPRDFAGGLNG